MENRTVRFNSLNLAPGTYLVGAKGSVSSDAYGFCDLVSGPEVTQTYWDTFGWPSGAAQVAVVLFSKITVTDLPMTNVAMNCGNGMAVQWEMDQPVMWAMPVAP
jgi:hypothetical protein